MLPGDSLGTMYRRYIAPGSSPGQRRAIDSFSLLAAALPLRPSSRNRRRPGAMSLQTQSRPATGHDMTPTKIPEGDRAIETS